MRAKLLDPRPYAVAAESPIADSVNIPSDELSARVHELPPPGMPVRMPDLPACRPAIDWLVDHGRIVILGDYRAGVPQRGRLWEPNPFLADVAPRLTPGYALDLGCGSGRDAVYLASLGWRVLAVDVLPDALERGRELSSRYLSDPSRVEWREADVRRGVPEGPFDLVTMFAFLHRPVAVDALSFLRPGGSLVLETFTTEHRRRHGRPASRELAIDPLEVDDWSTELERMRSSACQTGSRHTWRFWGRKPMPAESLE